MKIKADEKTPTAIEVTTTNVHGPVAHFFQSRFGITVTSEPGNEPERTELGKQAQNPNLGPSILGELKPGERFSETVDLKTLFNLKPGTNYRVKVIGGVLVEGKWTRIAAEGAIRSP
jgi:hypothetical protein